MAATKTTIPTKTTGDTLTATEFNELNNKYNDTVDVVNAKPDDSDIPSTTDELTEGSTNLYFTGARSANAPARRGTSATLDFSLYDDFAITCGASQVLTITNDSQGVYFKTFELTGGSLAANLFTHGTKSITETNNATAADYTAVSVNDLAAKFVIGASTIVINWYLKVNVYGNS